MLAVPDGSVGAVASPGLVEVGVGAVRKLVKPSAVGVDDADGCLPFSHFLVIHEPPKEDQHVTGLRPGRFEIPVPGRERFLLRCAEHVDVDFAVLVVGGAVAFFCEDGREAQKRQRKMDDGR